MELRETESIGVLDDHHRGVGNIDADFDHNRCNQRVNLASAKLIHDGVTLLALHASVHCGKSRACEWTSAQRFEMRCDIFETKVAFFYRRHDDKRLFAAVDALLHEAIRLIRA